MLDDRLGPEFTPSLDNRLDTAEVVRAIGRSRSLPPEDLRVPAELLAALRRNKVPLLSLALPPASSAPHEVRVLLDSTEFRAALGAEQTRCAGAPAGDVALAQALAWQPLP